MESQYYFLKFNYFHKLATIHRANKGFKGFIGDLVADLDSMLYLIYREISDYKTENNL